MFDVVDLSDQVVGQETRSFVHERGSFHRAVHIMIERPSGYWVLQQRASTKDLDPFLWERLHHNPIALLQEADIENASTEWKEKATA